MTLKERIRSGAAFHMEYVSLDLTASELAERAAGQDWDLVLVDLQHMPYTEPQLAEFCRIAAEHDLPVMVRIHHPDAPWIISRCLDFGAAGALVPMTEEPSRVTDAIQSFYYPPAGNRSCGLRYAYGYRAGMDPRQYADWWNETGILALQIETVKAVRNVRDLVQSGVDLLLFGGCDLGFSIGATPDSPFTSVEQCQAHVVARTHDLDVRVGVADVPFGRFEAVQ